MSLLHFFPLKDSEIVSGQNSELRLSDGRIVHDVGGASHGAAIVGHCHPRVVEAVRDQAGQLMHVAHLYPNPARTAFLDRLHHLLPDHLARTFICNSGTESVEAAFKFAAAATGRRRFVSMTNGFHGRTLAALSLTHKPAYREPMAGLTVDVDFATFNDIDALTQAVDKDTAAIVMEPVQGEGGVVPATGEFQRAARDLADDHGSLLVFDEVQTGMGRTGPFLAGTVEADIVCMGKGLAGGVPIGATMTTQAVADALPAGFHGSTYGGAPIACAAGAAALQVWQDERLAARSQSLGSSFAKGLRGLGHAAIKEVRAEGLMVNVDLRVRPGPVIDAMEAKGFLVLAGGKRGIRFLPPLTVDEQVLDEATAALAEALG